MLNYRNITTSCCVVETCKHDHEKDSGVFASVKEMHCISTVPEVPKTLCKPQPWRKALNQTYDYFALPFPDHPLWNTYRNIIRDNTCSEIAQFLFSALNLHTQ